MGAAAGGAGPVEVVVIRQLAGLLASVVIVAAWLVPVVLAIVLWI